MIFFFLFSFHCGRVHCLQIGACEPVTIDACQSFGTGGRPLLCSFQISSSVLLTPELLQQLPTSSYQCSFDLNRAALQPGLSYNITATATNFLLYSSSTKVIPFVSSSCEILHLVAERKCFSQAWSLVEKT